MQEEAKGAKGMQEATALLEEYEHARKANFAEYASFTNDLKEKIAEHNK